jgi:hypothetical protein
VPHTPPLVGWYSETFDTWRAARGSIDLLHEGVKGNQVPRSVDGRWQKSVLNSKTCKDSHTSRGIADGLVLQRSIGAVREQSIRSGSKKQRLQATRRSKHGAGCLVRMLSFPIFAYLISYSNLNSRSLRACDGPRITNSQVRDVYTSWLAAHAVEHRSLIHLFPSADQYASEAIPDASFGGIRQPRQYPSRVRSPMLTAKLLAGFALSGGGEILIGALFRLNADQSQEHKQSNRGAVLPLTRHSIE